MKKTIFTLLLGCLLFLSYNLAAQNTEGLFRLKEGDWFEMQVEQNNCDGCITNYLLRYQLEKQFPNANQQYKVSLEHFKAKWELTKNSRVGYDSYYPKFVEDKTVPDQKVQFKMELTPVGEIVNLVRVGKKPSNVVLEELNSTYKRNYNVSHSRDTDDSLMVCIISSSLALPFSKPGFGNEIPVYIYGPAKINNRTETKLDGVMQAEVEFKKSLPVKIPYLKETGVPLLVTLPDKQLVLTNASFPLSNNTIIQGKLKDQANQKITISMIGGSADYYFPGKQFQTNSDGSFSCPVFLKRSLHLRVQVGNKTLTTFMEPGDTLNISAIGHQAREIQYNQYADTKPNGYFSADLKKTDYFSGNAAYNTMLSNELDQYRNGFVYEKEVGSVIINAKKTAGAVNQLIESYRGKASEECITYFQLDFQYFLAAAKLYFDTNRQITNWENLRNKNSEQRSNSERSEIDYPTDFFLEVDTMPILMNPHEWNSSYQNFIQKAQEFKQKRLGWSVGKMNSIGQMGADKIFYDDYALSQASLQGFPLYNQIARTIDIGMRNGILNEIVGTSYYNDFINNCADPAMTEPLKKAYETFIQLKIGNTFPVKEFALKDSSVFRFDKYKGKPVCLILFDGPKSSLNQFKENIEKFKPEEVEFIAV